MFKKLLKEELDGLEGLEDILTDPPEDELEGIEEVPGASEEEDIDDGLGIGTQVTVQDSGSFTAEELGMTEDDFATFHQKVEESAYAVVFDINDEDQNKVSIVFEDGFEVFDIPRIILAPFAEELDDL